MTDIERAAKSPQSAIEAAVAKARELEAATSELRRDAYKAHCYHTHKLLWDVVEAAAGIRTGTRIGLGPPMSGEVVVLSAEVWKTITDALDALAKAVNGGEG